MPGGLRVMVGGTVGQIADSCGRSGDVWPGAIVGTVLFQISFQALPLYLRFSDQLLALRAFGGLVILLVWLYLMANIIVLGAEINWFHWSRRQPPTEEELAGGLA